MWSIGRHKWDVSHALRTPEQGLALVSFFVARRGKARGFRFKDHNDYLATDELLLQTGSKFVQLRRVYSSGGVEYLRDLFKISNVGFGGVDATMTRNSIAFTAFSLDVDTGLATLTADVTRTVTLITQAANAVISSVAHGYLAGDFIYIEAVNGMTQINGQVVEVVSVNANDFTVDLDTTGYSAYTSGGTAAYYVQPSEILRWSGEFHVPSRFDTDEMNLSQSDSQIRDWQSIPVLEIIA